MKREDNDPRLRPGLPKWVRHAPLDELTEEDLDPATWTPTPGRPRKYESNAERQRAYRQRKAEKRSREWAERLGVDLPPGTVLTSRDYGRIGNEVKAGRLRRGPRRPSGEAPKPPR